MPEILEIEMYRRGAAPIVGRTITRVEAPDDWYLKGIESGAITSLLRGATVTGLDRIGKLMLVETSTCTLGLKFGMTGRLVVDDVPVIEALEYSSKRLDDAWVRFELGFAGGGAVQMNDPRRLGGVVVDPELERLGVDAWLITTDQLVALTSSTSRAIKALLLDQKRIAGLGNLLIDELLWRCGTDPRRAANEILSDDVATLRSVLRAMLNELYERGGSHLGDHVPLRTPGALCSLDGAAMAGYKVASRSTWSCSAHQR